MGTLFMGFFAGSILLTILVKMLFKGGIFTIIAIVIIACIGISVAFKK